jgi:hypothetical protein
MNRFFVAYDERTRLCGVNAARAAESVPGIWIRLRCNCLAKRFGF